ncbi:MAG: rRNA pseudouridine synthase [Magnetococcales bacterium]|nr:rRNA pseudouridine synthase [Magnetococcales bacterium]MBF0420624.1 rRNA pseudouridine synthase [Magnetococcales bacterium]
MAEPMRLQKWLAQAGLCSRREGERWIAMGRVAINNQIVTQPGCLVGDLDRVKVDGKPIEGKGKRSHVVLAFHKPPDVVCTRHDPEKRKTIYDYLENVPERLLYVGRLDISSEGLIVLTDNGDLVHRLTHPSAQVPRCYRVRVHGRINDATLQSLQQGVQLEDGPTGPLEVTVDRNTSANNWLTMTLREGRNRIVRRIFETLDMKVSRLIRISYGPISLGELPRGHWRFLSTSEQKQLHQSAEGISPPSGASQKKGTSHQRP